MLTTINSSQRCHQRLGSLHGKYVPMYLTTLGSRLRLKAAYWSWIQIMLWEVYEDLYCSGAVGILYIYKLK